MAEYDGLANRLSNPVEVDAGCYAERRSGDMQAAVAAITDLQPRLRAAEKELAQERRERECRDALIKDHLAKIMHLENRIEEEFYSAVSAKAALARCNRIDALAATGTTDSFMMLPNKEKREWFAIAIDESARRRDAETRIAALEREREGLRNEVEALRLFMKAKSSASADHWGRR